MKELKINKNAGEELKEKLTNSTLEDLLILSIL